MVEQPMRVALVLFGVIPRSIRWTWPVFERQLLEPLRARGHVVDIYGFNVEVHSPVVDDMPLNQSDVALVPFAALDSWRQEDIDSVIARLCPDGVLKCKSFDDQALAYIRDPRVDVKVGLSMSTKGYMNAFRQLHTEMRVARFMASSSHDVAIAAVPDLHLAKKIDTAELHRAASDPAVAFTTTVNDAGGYTNGFYIGQPKTLAKVLDRFGNHREVATSMPGGTNFETHVRKGFAMRGVRRIISGMTFFKIRATGMPDWQGKMDYQLSRYGPASQREILSEWRAVNERNCAFMRAGCACGNGQVRIGLYGSHHWRSPWKEVRPNSTGVKATDNSGRSGLFSLVRCWEDFFGEQSFIRDPDLLEHQGCKTHKNCIICQCRLDFAPFVGKFCPELEPDCAPRARDLQCAHSTEREAAECS